MSNVSIKNPVINPPKSSFPISNPVIKPEGSGFDLGRARELLHLVDIAHTEFEKSKDDQSWNWDRDSQTPIESYELLTRFGFAGYFLGKRRRVPFGFVLKKDSDLFVIFRGTLAPQEWAGNARARQVDFLGKQSFGEVHKGFHAMYTRKDKGEFFDIDLSDDLPSMKTVIEDTIERFIKENTSEISQIFVAGHSLGGALATLSALHISKIDSCPSPTLYSFASPRAGDSNFAQQFKGLECYRIANSEDRVTNIPWSVAFISMLFPRTGSILLKLIGDKLDEKQSWEHIGQPIYFTAQCGNIPDNHTIPVYTAALG